MPRLPFRRSMCYRRIAWAGLSGVVIDRTSPTNWRRSETTRRRACRPMMVSALQAPTRQRDRLGCYVINSGVRQDRLRVDLCKCYQRFLERGKINGRGNATRCVYDGAQDCAMSWGRERMFDPAPSTSKTLLISASDWAIYEQTRRDLSRLAPLTEQATCCLLTSSK